MSDNHDDYYNLAQRIKDNFSAIESDIVTDLVKTDSDYANLRRDASKLQQDYPMIDDVLEGGGAISLATDEHEALARYIDLIRQMEYLERRQIYFRGHTDCFAYLKKTGMI